MFVPQERRYPGISRAALAAAPPTRTRCASPRACSPSWDELLSRFSHLPDTFPQTKRHAAELTAGTDHERFDFTVELMLGGLARR
ncbi:hypothetical protein [Streptomyces sp. 769]|uniref:hypothetical protein n=1 Tax=Streptomyces sp. 769 TaxID=1262452 RepID=UPI000581FBFE|nr:putative TetR-family transcriptional regulator [Streptomyces sp. 769]